MFEATRDLIKDLWSFIKERQKYLLIPLIVTLLLVGTLIVFVQTSVLTPFVYTLF